MTRPKGRPNGAREWTDADFIDSTIELQRRCGMHWAGRLLVKDAIYTHARHDTRNELQDYLNGLRWDGEGRIDKFFEDVCGSPGGPYYEAVGRNFFLSLVARAMRPGCKADCMIVMEGAQSAKKSTLLEVLASKRWYTVMRDAPESKDFAIVLQGKWVIEIAELDAFSRSDVKSTKRTLSTSADRYRSPYGTVAEDHERMSIFAGTTNKDDYLTDETGARRFWPVRCEHIRIDLAELYRDQYFAEAMHRLSAGETWWEVPPEETKAEQDARYDEDPWTEPVRESLLGRVTFKMTWLLSELGLQTDKQDMRALHRVGAILRRLGWVKRQQATPSGPRKIWVKMAEERAAQTPADAPGPPETPEGR